MRQTGPDFVAALENAVGRNAVKHGGLAELYDPGLHPKNLDADLMVRPASTRDVAAVVRLCADAGVAIVPHGGRTGLAGGAISGPGQVIIDLSSMDRISDIDPVALTATVEAGVRLEKLQEAALQHGLSPGIDLPARGSATVGGMISTNAGGIEAFRNGTMVNRLLGVEVVLASGEIADELKLVPKANEGYRLTRLVAGAEGTLGIVTRAVISLEPAQVERNTALVSTASADGALALYRRIRQSGTLRLLAAEIMWPRFARTVAAEIGADGVLSFAPADNAVFAIFDVAADAGAHEAFEAVVMDAAEAGEVTNAIFAKSERERETIWRIREEARTVAQRYPGGTWYDVSVPQARLDRYVADLEARSAAFDPDLRLYVMGHMGDGNLHLTLSKGEALPSNYGREIEEIVYAGLDAVGGSFSAEHGIGTAKRAALASHASPARLSVMRAIKSALDPKNILNPGKVV